MRARILVLYTGGTIGMRASAAGYVPAPDFGARALAALRAQAAELPAFELREYAEPLDSANIRPRDWLRMARDITDAASAYDGFVVLHGTDTMAYTGSALAFLLLGLGKPVILTGSMIPLAEAGTDAIENLVRALQLAASPDIGEVCLLLGRRLLRANRATKWHTRAHDAFESPNYPPLGHIERHGTRVRLDTERLLGPAAEQPEPVLPTALSHKVVIQPFFPGIEAATWRSFIERGVEAAVAPCYGRGTAPDADRELMDCLDEAIAGGMVVIAVAQCPKGGIALGTYGPGMALRARGVVDGRDLTVEAAFTKLHWLCAKGYTAPEIKARLAVPICGELTT